MRDSGSGSVTRDSGSGSSSDSSKDNDPSGKRKWNKYENKGGKVTKLLTSALASFNSEDRIQMMKKKGEQTDKLINLARESMS